MVKDPGQYNWSSYPINALGKASELCKPHPEYLKLSKRKDARMRRYQALFKAHVEGELLAEIRSGLNKEWHWVMIDLRRRWRSKLVGD